MGNSKLPWHTRQPPKSPFIKGDLRNSPLPKGAGDCFIGVCYVSKKLLPKTAYLGVWNFKLSKIEMLHSVQHDTKVTHSLCHSEVKLKNLEAQDDV